MRSIVAEFYMFKAHTFRKQKCLFGALCHNYLLKHFNAHLKTIIHFVVRKSYRSIRTSLPVSGSIIYNDTMCLAVIFCRYVPFSTAV